MLVNIDFEICVLKVEYMVLNIIWIGIFGFLWVDFLVDSFVVLVYGIGFDNMFFFY